MTTLATAAGDWTKVSEAPLRCEHPMLGAYEDLPDSPLVQVEPKCGHKFRALSGADARRSLERFGGLCLKCARRGGS